MKKKISPTSLLVITLPLIFLVLIMACSLTATNSNEDAIQATLIELSIQNEAQATELARHMEFISYLATRGPYVSTPIPPGAEPTPYRPVVGSVEIEKGRCCVSGTVGEPTEFTAVFEATSLEGEPVTDMRLRLGTMPASEEQMDFARWEPYETQQSFAVDTAINWMSYTLSVQFRDQAGHLSKIYTDEISVEGMPSKDPSASREWKTYQNLAGGFSISIPSHLEIVEKSGLLGGLIGDRIDFHVLDQSAYWVDCQEGGIGDCPVMEEIHQVQVSSLQATRIYGYIGAIGGNIPQEYVTYVIENAGRYYIFTLWAMDLTTQSVEVNGILPLAPQAIEDFDSMMQTFQLED